MRAVMILSLLFLVEPAVTGVDGLLLLALAALGLTVVLVTGVAAEKLMDRPPEGDRKPEIAVGGARQTVRSVPEMARDRGLSQDAVRQMLRRTSHSGHAPYQEKLAGPGAERSREPWSISPAGVR